MAQNNDSPELIQFENEERLFLLSVKGQNLARRKLSLKDCFERADKNNKEILVSESSLPISRAAITIAKAIPNPTVNALYGWGNAFNYIVAGNAQQVGLTEEIQVAGKRTKKADLARANYGQTLYQFQALRFDVHNRVRRAYAELVAAHAYDDLVTAQRKLARELLRISEKRLAAGSAPGSEVMQARLVVMQIDALRNQSWGRILQASNRLAALLGETALQAEIIDPEENSLFRFSNEHNSLSPDLLSPPPELKALLPLAWAQRPDLKAAIQSAYADKKALTLAKTQRIPDPTFSFQYYYSTYKPYQFGFFDPQGVLPYLQNMFPNVPLLQTNYHNPNPPVNLVKTLYTQSFFVNAQQNFAAQAAAAAAAAAPPSGGCAPPSGGCAPPSGGCAPPSGGCAPPSSTSTTSTQAAPDITKDKVPFQPGYQLIVQHETPIFYQYQGQINQAKATLARQVKQNDQLRAQIASDIVTSYESMLFARATVRKLREEALPVASRVSSMAHLAYERGLTDLATAILAMQQYQQILASYFDAVLSYQKAWADLEKAVGVPLQN
jgi:outer membrane protein TolC